MKLLKLTALVLVFSGAAAFGAQQKQETPDVRVTKKLNEIIFLLKNNDCDQAFIWSCGGNPNTVEHGEQILEIQGLCAKWVTKIASKQGERLELQQQALARLTRAQQLMNDHKQGGKQE